MTKGKLCHLTLCYIEKPQVTQQYIHRKNFNRLANTLLMKKIFYKTYIFSLLVKWYHKLIT